jgi:hypothetical protein
VNGRRGPSLPLGLVVAFATGARAIGGVFATLLVLTYVAALVGEAG